MAKEETAIILDYLPNGYPLEKKMMPIAQAVGLNNLTLLELVPRRGETLDIGEEVYIGEGKRDKIYYILGRLHREKLTQAAKDQLIEVIQKVVGQDEEKYIKFFNNALPVNKRIHQLELLPGFGKKHTKELVTAREEKEFESFEELKKRVSNIPDPIKAIEKRIFQELTNMERFNLFIN